jgi:hypothetical protein
MMNTDGHLSDWNWWSLCPEYFELPWVGSLIVIVRMSNPLLQEIRRFVKKHNKLAFIEVLFVTLAYQNNMQIVNPEGLNKLDCCTVESDTSLYADHIIHPIKDPQKHLEWRSKE